VLTEAADYATLRAHFTWRVPARFNIAAACCDVWAAAEPDRPAILATGHAGEGVDILVYGDLKRRSEALAARLLAHGVRRGDRVALVLPQGHDVAIAHMAIYRIGAVALPLAALFGVDALEYRLRDSGAAALIAHGPALTKIAPVRAGLTALRLVVCTDGAAGEALDFAALAAPGVAPPPLVDTGPDDPAMMIYTSGTTGPPKGALHGHRVLVGHLPGVQMPHEFLPRPGDRSWTPADWAWAGGLLNILLPSLYFGVPVVAGRFEKFDPEAAYALIARQGVRNAFIPPTALRMLRAAPNPRGRHEMNLRSVGSGGESLGAETFAWGREALGLTINEFYGQTECNLVVASCAGIGVSKPGFMGKPVPGHEVAVIRPDGTVCEPRETGQIAVKRPDPVMFLEYWGQPEATARKFIGDWMTTGDQGMVDEEGYILFFGRDDDVITSAGYRIGPGEIEDCLIKHPVVALAAVIGKPDPVRTEIVKAFIVLKPGVAPGPALEEEIRLFVRGRLSAHEYPREIAFVDDLPMTTTGKIIRRLLRDGA
jgi:acetyl-CoA synthetase